MEVKRGSFEWALAYVKQGEVIRRDGWGYGLKYVALVKAGATGYMTSFLALCYPKGSDKYPEGLIVPWTPTCCDLLEGDWYLVEQSENDF